MEIPFIFPNNLIHKEVADAMKPVVKSTFGDPPNVTVVSAGDYAPDFDGCCSGSSTSLGLKSREEEDDLLISMNDYGAGFK